MWTPEVALPVNDTSGSPDFWYRASFIKIISHPRVKKIAILINIIPKLDFLTEDKIKITPELPSTLLKWCRNPLL